MRIGALRLHRLDGSKLRKAALAVIAWWDSMDGIPRDDRMTTEQVAQEMDRRIHALRDALHV